MCVCELASCAEETACEKSPVESLMDVNARLLLSSALSLQTARKKGEKNGNVNAAQGPWAEGRS